MHFKNGTFGVLTIGSTLECWGGTGRQLDIGLYREDTGERLLYSLNGQPISDHLEIALDN